MFGEILTKEAISVALKGLIQSCKGLFKKTPLSLMAAV